MDINSVVLNGRCVRDTELKYTNSGTAVANFSIAVNRRAKGANGEWGEEPNFFDCAMWGKRAEALSQYITKGKQISIRGELKQQRWESEGQKRSKVQIEVADLQLLGRQDGKPKQQQQAQTPQPANAQFEDDIPF